MSQDHVVNVDVVQIAKLQLQVGDTLVVHVPFVLRADQADRCRAMFNSVIPDGVTALILDAGVTLSVLEGNETNNA